MSRLRTDYIMLRSLQNHKETFWSIRVFKFGWMALCLGLLCLAERPTIAAPPPKMPPRFDKATVQKLIRDIDQEQNAVILKVGYFVRRGAHPLPTREGFALLSSAAAQEKPTSRRLFLLQATRAFAAFLVGPDTRKEGYDAYEAILNRSAQAEKVGAEDVVQRAIYEFAFTLPSEYGTDNYGVGRSQGVLLKALSTHLEYLKENPSTKYKIQWIKAIGATGGGADFVPLVEKALQTPGALKNYALLRTAAEVYQAVDVERAIELFQRAKLLLPRGDDEQARSLYEALVNLLEYSDKPAEAMAAQQELVQLTGRGYAQLALVQFRSGKREALQATLDTLAVPGANEQEINDTATQLFKLFESDRVGNEKANVFAAGLLSNYLEGERERNVQQELRARLMLARYLLGYQHRPTQAREVLAIERFKTPLPNPYAQATYNVMQRLDSKLKSLQDTKLKDTKE